MLADLKGVGAMHLTKAKARRQMRPFTKADVGSFDKNGARQQPHNALFCDGVSSMLRAGRPSGLKSRRHDRSDKASGRKLHDAAEEIRQAGTGPSLQRSLSRSAHVLHDDRLVRPFITNPPGRRRRASLRGRRYRRPAIGRWSKPSPILPATPI
jgi:hypothetical protein